MCIASCLISSLLFRFALALLLLPLLHCWVVIIFRTYTLSYSGHLSRLLSRPLGALIAIFLPSYFVSSLFHLSTYLFRFACIYSLSNVLLVDTLFSAGSQFFPCSSLSCCFVFASAAVFCVSSLCHADNYGSSHLICQTTRAQITFRTSWWRFWPLSSVA